MDLQTEKGSVSHSPEWSSLKVQRRPSNHRLEASQVVNDWRAEEVKYPVPELRAVDKSLPSNKSATTTDSNSEPEEDQSRSLPRRPPSPEPPK